MKQLTLLMGSFVLTASISIQAETIRDAYCKRLPEGDVCAKLTDTLVEPPPKNSVSIEGGTLTVTTKNGTDLRWVGGEGEDAARYSALYIPRYRFFWVHGHLYEGMSDEWVSYETGTSYKFSGFPFRSPDGRFILVKDSPYGADSSFIKIYALGTSQISEVANFDIGRLQQECGERIGDPIWVTSEEVAVFSGYDEKKTPRARLLARIKKNADTWTVVHEENK